MKRTFLFAVIFLFTTVLFAQKDTTYYKHEIRVSAGDAFLANFFWTYDTWGDPRNNANLYANVALSYFYRPLKWFWVGGNFVNYLGSKISYNWREYDTDVNYKDLSKSKMKYCAVIAPEIRFSYLNTKEVILYSALSGGVCVEDGFTKNHYKYPEINFYFHITMFGVSGNLGKNKNIFLGGEFGIGMKGFGNIHCGYRF